MKSPGTNVETKQRNQRKAAHLARNWWILPIVAMLASPAPSWSQFKQPMSSEISSGGDLDWAASFSGDMLDVVWVSDQAQDGVTLWDIWGARRESIGAPWQEPELLDVVNTNRTESAPHLSYDGLTLTFTSDGRDGGYGGLDLWQTMRATRDDPWQEPVNMGPTINTRSNEGGATFSTDGLELIFNSGCNGACSPSILRRSTRKTLNDDWTIPERMRPKDRGDLVGSAAYPSLSPDGLSLYFNTDGSYGNWDVFVSKRPSLDAPFGEKENLGAMINTSGRETGVRIAPDGSLYYGYRWSPGQRLTIWRAEADSIAIPLGDYNNNGVLDISDIDDLVVQVAAGENPIAYDLNNDAMVNIEDIRVWTKDLANTWIGDANLDGQFDSSDLVEVFQTGGYEDDIAENSTWATGDWNGDAEFDTGDLVAAFQDGGFGKGNRQSVATVPEPSTAVLLLIGLIGALGRQLATKR